MLRGSCAVGLALFALGAAQAGEGACCATVTGSLLSVALDQIALGDALDLVGIDAGVRVEIRGELGDVRPQRFQDVPLTEGLRRLVGDHPMLMLGIEDGIPRRIVVTAANSSGGPADQISLVGQVAVTESYAELAELDPQARVAALMRAARQQGEAALPLLGEALDKDADPGVREAVIAELAALQTDGAWSLIDRGLQDESPEVRIEALRAQMHGSEGFPYGLLTSSLLNDPDLGVQVAVAQMLGDRGGAEIPQVRQAFRQVLAQASDRELRDAAAEGLRPR